jgi:glycosyltransferase involved in cell wall biosynthesis
LDTKRFEPIILCYERNNYTKILEELPVKTIFLYNKKEGAGTSAPIRKTKPSLQFLKKIKRFFIDDVVMSRKIRAIIKENNIDLLHHNTDFPFCTQALLANVPLKLPQVCHYRSLKPYEPYSFDLITSRRLAKKIDRHIYISNAVEKHFTRVLKIPPAKGIVVRDIVDVEKFKPGIPGNSITKELNLNGEVVVSCIGRIIPWKGQHIFIEALAHVARKHPDIKALVVGPFEKGVGDVSYYNHLVKLTHELALDGKVIFTGNRNDIPEILGVSDIVVHSSVEPEPQGLIIVEALLNRKPVVVADAGGASELVIDEQDGLKVVPGNVIEMAAAICTLIEKNRSQSSADLKRVPAILSEFVPQNQIKLIEGLYDELLN